MPDPADPESAVPSAASLPAKRRPPRAGEWTREKMVLFLRELAATQSVSLAAKAVGMGRTSAYNLRNRLQNTPFALGWEVALEMGMHQLAHAVMDRALNGTEVQHYYHGELVGTTRRHDNRLAQWVLENPWRLGRSQMAREYVAGNFDALLERIAAAGLDWEEGDDLPGPGWPFDDPAEAAERQDEFERGSWYGAEAGTYDARKARGRGPGG